MRREGFPFVSFEEDRFEKQRAQVSLSSVEQLNKRTNDDDDVGPPPQQQHRKAMNPEGESPLTASSSQRGALGGIATVQCSSEELDFVVVLGSPALGKGSSARQFSFLLRIALPCPFCRAHGRYSAVIKGGKKLEPKKNVFFCLSLAGLLCAIFRHTNYVRRLLFFLFFIRVSFFELGGDGCFSFSGRFAEQSFCISDE